MIFTGFQQKLQEFYRNLRKITGINYWINAAEGGEKITGIPETLKKTLVTMVPCSISTVSRVGMSKTIQKRLEMISLMFSISFSFNFAKIIFRQRV